MEAAYHPLRLVDEDAIIGFPICFGVARINPILFSRTFFLFAPFAGDPSSSPFLSTFSPFSPPQEVLCSVERRAQDRALGGAVSG